MSKISFKQKIVRLGVKQENARFMQRIRRKTTERSELNAPRTIDVQRPIMKKSQIEMMGLLVIVILILIVVFFSLSFSINNEQRQPKQKDFLDAMMTDGLAPAMLETSTECGFTIRELLADCAYAKDISCQGLDSCTFVNETMKNLLDQTLVEQQKSFWLAVKTSQGAITTFNDTGCSGQKERERSSRRTTPFETSHQLMFFVVTLCQD